MMLNRRQFEEAIREVLATAPRKVDGDAAVRLLLGTAAAESEFGHYLRQITGPARGVFQVEPATAEWLEQTSRGDFVYWLQKFRGNESIPWALQYRLDYSIACCRMRYLKVVAPIPAGRTEQAQYWKQHYNTFAGKGTLEGYLRKYNQYVGA